MTNDLRERAKALLGAEFSWDVYFALLGNTLTIDGEFTLAELKAIVQAWEQRNGDNSSRPDFDTPSSTDGGPKVKAI